jgi:hypothetical protein
MRPTPKTSAIPTRHRPGVVHVASPGCVSGPFPILRLWRKPFGLRAESGSTGIDSTPALDEPVQRLRVRLVTHSVPHHAAPFAPRSFVRLGRVGRAPDDGGERVFPLRDRQPLQAQSPASSVDFAAFRGPPHHQAVHGGQVGNSACTSRPSEAAPIPMRFAPVPPFGWATRPPKPPREPRSTPSPLSRRDGRKVDPGVLAHLVKCMLPVVREGPNLGRPTALFDCLGPFRADMCGRLRVGKGFLHASSSGRSSHVFGLLARFT